MTKRQIVILSVIISIFAIVYFLKRKNVNRWVFMRISEARTSNNIKSLHPKIRNMAKEFVNRAKKELNMDVAIISGYRSFAEQDKLRKKYLAGEGGKALPAGHSMHQYGLGFDTVEVSPMYGFAKGYPESRWNKIGAIGKKIGFEWGGDWKSKDRPHFQKTFNKDYKQLLAKVEEGKTIKDVYPRV